MGREIIAEPGNPYPASYHCSQCGWSFVFKRFSFVIEYLEEREAQASFKHHDCANFPPLQKQA